MDIEKLNGHDTADPKALRALWMQELAGRLTSMTS